MNFLWIAKIQEELDRVNLLESRSFS